MASPQIAPKQRRGRQAIAARGLSFLRPADKVHREIGGSFVVRAGVSNAERRIE